MNDDVCAAQWKHMHGELKAWQGKLADDDLDKIARGQRRPAECALEGAGA